MVHHTIVALEAIHSPLPEFKLPEPHTHTLTSYLRTSREDLHDRIRDATIIINVVHPLDSVALSEEITPHLQLIAVMGSGYDSVDLETCRRRGIRVTNCPHANVHTVAEHVIGMYFAARRRTVIMHERTMGTLGSGTEWKERATLAQYMRVRGDAPLNCEDEILGIVGYGAIGKRIALLAGALGMKVIVAGRKGEEAATEDRVSFADVLQKATVLVLCCPRTPETVNLMSDPEFKAMRPDALLINVSRGGIVDEAALLTALKTEQIAGAAADVFLKEPGEAGRYASSPLLGSEAQGLNITVSPHVAWFGEKTMANYQRILRENIEGWVAGKEQNIVA
ncbi:uncharacterized protein K452DRAFT_296238 [Aplosporella prunicola CBS 121167]|uniref:D-isomer specific 2-hydroxyacid dehydrogenase NAD-binding domain-containing protein n=1 Tax=Aplosporella prunicola CBS 121167 TaxID=1176127 RepID=A0A6A6BIL9_9PEZI|nr:uncharacterized protein K452DRAFT_296238 [Aplosporella prunicola CBS 121167]KAF2143969.1 hypothetical protein K452DRAFT_296238 [Aplosporella prunicola CBS 121167]